MTRAQKRRLTSLLLSLAVLGIGWYLNQHPNTLQSINQALPAGTYKVTNFDDGDTIVVDMNGKNETIRFIGVDTPETHDPRKVVQCYGQVAADYTKQLISNQPVRLEADPLSTNRDRYDRLLRYIYLPDGKLVNDEIIKNGYGFAYLSFPFTKSDQFHTDELSAQKAKLGLWGKCSPSVNQYGGYTSNPAN